MLCDEAHSGRSRAIPHQEQPKTLEFAIFGPIKRCVRQFPAHWARPANLMKPLPLDTLHGKARG
jgi:hypothetical protein